MVCFLFACLIDGCSYLGLLFLVVALTCQQNTRTAVQVAVGKLLAGILQTLLSEKSFVIKLIDGSDQGDVPVDSCQLNVKAWTVVLVRLGWKTRSDTREEQLCFESTASSGSKAHAHA
jgi:hypothetical protein